ncbi:MAG: hypothetical protein JST54_29930 [Deltaproteobacteria bacterium]|nr:hypothetical protein [Deltaproteobacteria bacterium]
MRIVVFVSQEESRRPTQRGAFRASRWIESGKRLDEVRDRDPKQAVRQLMIQFFEQLVAHARANPKWEPPKKLEFVIVDGEASRYGRRG